MKLIECWTWALNHRLGKLSNKSALVSLLSISLLFTESMLITELYSLESSLFVGENDFASFTMMFSCCWFLSPSQNRMEHLGLFSPCPFWQAAVFLFSFRVKPCLWSYSLYVYPSCFEHICWPFMMSYCRRSISFLHNSRDAKVSK